MEISSLERRIQMDKIKYIGDTTPEVHILRDATKTGCGKDITKNPDLWIKVSNNEKVTCGHEGCAGKLVLF